MQSSTKEAEDHAVVNGQAQIVQGFHPAEVLGQILAANCFHDQVCTPSSYDLSAAIPQKHKVRWTSRLPERETDSALILVTRSASWIAYEIGNGVRKSLTPDFPGVVVETKSVHQFL